MSGETWEGGEGRLEGRRQGETWEGREGRLEGGRQGEDRVRYIKCVKIEEHRKG